MGHRTAGDPDSGEDLPKSGMGEGVGNDHYFPAGRVRILGVRELSIQQNGWTSLLKEEGQERDALEREEEK